MRRVVVTGIGAISALGLNADEFREELFAGRTGLKDATSVDLSDIRYSKVGEVRGFDEKEHFEKKMLPFLDRFSHFGVVSAREAINDAGMKWETETEKERTAIITGTGAGGQSNLDQYYIDLFVKKKETLSANGRPKGNE